MAQTIPYTIVSDPGCNEFMRNIGGIVIKTKPQEITPFVSTIAARADAEKLALGFMPESV